MGVVRAEVGCGLIGCESLVGVVTLGVVGGVHTKVQGFVTGRRQHFVGRQVSLVANKYSSTKVGFFLGEARVGL